MQIEEAFRYITEGFSNYLLPITFLLRSTAFFAAGQPYTLYNVNRRQQPGSYKVCGKARVYKQYAAKEKDHPLEPY